ncbi:MAG TPA: SPOR domain-containing protein [Candidatus Hydrogenedens sp.]|nr:SPOR domain-containing protein [Candidatus Hydrogenedens sp.]
MSDYFPFPRNKGKDPEGIYLSSKSLVYTIVILIFCFIFVFLLGVYFGRRNVLTTLSKNETTITATPEATTSTETTVKTDSISSDNQTSMQTSPTTNNAPANAIPASTTNEPSAVQPVSQTSIATDTTTIPDQQKTPAATDITSIPEQQKTTTTTETTDSPLPTKTTIATSKGKPQDQVSTELTPITPPIDQDINGSGKSKNVSDKASTKTTVNQNPKTFSIQLSALSGDDAENRARVLVEKMKEKYSQFQFRIQHVENLYKISVINLPDEKTAKEALKILSQESNFKKAFIVKPQK